MRHLVSLLALLGLAACGGGAKEPPPPAQACLDMPIQMEGDGSLAVPPSCMQGCMEDWECTVINTSCPGCCEFMPMSKSYLEHYEKFTVTECKKYHGLVCGCDEKPAQAACVNNVCTF